MKTPHPVTAVWLRSNARGDRVEVLVESNGSWWSVIAKQQVGPGCIVSHIVESAGMAIAPLDVLNAPAGVER